MNQTSRNIGIGKSRRAEAGLTVLEMVVVLAILVATTGLLVYNIAPEGMRFGGAGAGRNPAEIATITTMRTLREAIVGDGSHQGYWDDLGHNAEYFPAKDRFRYLFSVPDNIPSEYQSLQKFSPSRKLGWRGPYFQGTGATFPLVDSGNGFTSAYLPTGGTNTYPTLVDGWGNPLVIQGPFPNTAWTVSQVKRARIVSAGPNGRLETSTDPSTYDTPEESDDILLYIFAEE